MKILNIAVYFKVNFESNNMISSKDNNKIIIKLQS